MRKRVLVVLCIVMICLFGWVATEIFHTQKATAAKTIEYKLVKVGCAIEKSDVSPMEKIINDQARQGWKLHSAWGGTDILFFER